MAYQKSFTEVAKHCSQFTPVSQNSMNNSMSNSMTNSNSCTSCLSCTHFKSQHCELDLYDQIATNTNDGLK